MDDLLRRVADPDGWYHFEGEPADLKKLTEFLEDDYNGNRVAIDCTASQEVRPDCYPCPWPGGHPPALP